MRTAGLSSIFVCLALELGELLYSCLPEQGKEDPLFFPLLFPGRSEAHLKYRGLTRMSSMQNWKVFLFPCAWTEPLLPSIQNLWSQSSGSQKLKEAILVFSRPPLALVPLHSLAQSNQCADYCTTALSWTGSLNTGATEQVGVRVTLILLSPVG